MIHRSEDPHTPETLDTLLPTEGSVPWLRQHNQFKEMFALERRAAFSIQVLRNYETTQFDKESVIPFVELAAQTVSPMLFDWTTFHALYHEPPITEADFLGEDGEPTPEYRRYLTTQMNYARNSAVDQRDQASNLHKLGDKERAAGKWKSAQSFYEWYQEVKESINNLSEVSISQNDHELSKQNVIFLSDPTAIDTIPFEDAVADAVEEFGELFEKLIEGHGFVPGVNNRILRTYDTHYMIKPEFTFVTDEFLKVRHYIAERNGVTVEDMDRYTEWLNGLPDNSS